MEEEWKREVINTSYSTLFIVSYIFVYINQCVHHL
jgi:hypothetical protein